VMGHRLGSPVIIKSDSVSVAYVYRQRGKRALVESLSDIVAISKMACPSIV
jgi:hypothetical protein